MTEQSASAQLRQTQAALAASQQDLTRALAERDQLREELSRLRTADARTDPHSTTTDSPPNPGAGPRKEEF